MAPQGTGLKRCHSSLESCRQKGSQEGKSLIRGPGTAQLCLSDIVTSDARTPLILLCHCWTGQ